MRIFKYLYKSALVAGFAVLSGCSGLGLVDGLTPASGYRPVKIIAYGLKPAKSWTSTDRWAKGPIRSRSSFMAAVGRWGIVPNIASSARAWLLPAF
jgi:hypothetical protein